MENLDFHGTKLNENLAKMKNFLENEVENFEENFPKLTKILNEKERMLFVHFCQFRSTKP